MRRVRLLHGRADTLQADFREALAMAERLGMRPLAARCHLALSRRDHQTIEPELAGEHLATARKLLRSLEMEP